MRRDQVAELLAQQTLGLAFQPALDSLKAQGEAIMRRLEQDGFCFLMIQHQSTEGAEISSEIVDGLDIQSKTNPTAP